MDERVILDHYRTSLDQMISLQVVNIFASDPDEGTRKMAEQVLTDLYPLLGRRRVRTNIARQELVSLYLEADSARAAVIEKILLKLPGGVESEEAEAALIKLLKNPESAWNQSPERIPKIFVKYIYNTAKTLDEDRRMFNYTLYFAFKNQPRKNPVLVDLSRMDGRPNAVLAEMNTNSLGQTIPAIGPPIEYEYQVLNLRKGDTVVYDGVSYILGEFLEAGNATHIFSLANDPENVIRIPFLSAELMKPDTIQRSIDVDNRIARLQYYIKLYETRMKGQDGGVPVKHYDPKHRFIIAKKINGKQTGFKFLVSIDPTGAPGTLRYLEMKNESGSFTFKFPADRKKFQLLFDMMVKNDDVELLDPLINQWELDYRKARNYLWDEKEYRWYKVDAE